MFSYFTFVDVRPRTTTFEDPAVGATLTESRRVKRSPTPPCGSHDVPNGVDPSCTQPQRKAVQTVCPHLREVDQLASWPHAAVSKLARLHTVAKNHIEATEQVQTRAYEKRSFQMQDFSSYIGGPDTTQSGYAHLRPATERFLTE